MTLAVAVALALVAAPTGGAGAAPATAVTSRAGTACTVLTKADIERVTGQQAARANRQRLEDGSTQCVWDLNGGFGRDNPTGGTLDVRAGRFDDAKAQLADTRREAERSAGKTRSVPAIGDAALLAGGDTFSVIIARKARAIVSIGSKLNVAKGVAAPPAGGFAEREVVRWLTELAAIALPRA